MKTPTLRYAASFFFVMSAGLMTAHCGAPGAPGAVDQENSRASSLASGSPIHPSLSPALCLDVYGGDAKAGAGIDSYTCNGGDNQAWAFNTGELTVFGTFCLDVPANPPDAMPPPLEGLHLDIQPCADGDQNMQWIRAADAWQWSAHPEYCLEVENGSYGAGAPVRIATCVNGSSAQMWSDPGGQAKITADTLTPAASTDPSALAQACVDTINQLRMAANVPAVTLAGDKIACVAGEAAADGATTTIAELPTTFTQFGQCGESDALEVAIDLADDARLESIFPDMVLFYGNHYDDSTRGLLLDPTVKSVACGTANSAVSTQLIAFYR